MKVHKAVWKSFNVGVVGQEAKCGAWRLNKKLQFKLLTSERWKSVTCKKCLRYLTPPKASEGI